MPRGGTGDELRPRYHEVGPDADGPCDGGHRRGRGVAPMAKMTGEQYVAQHMTDAECAMADALVAVAPSEPPPMVRHEAVFIVQWLARHGWLLTRQTED